MSLDFMTILGTETFWTALGAIGAIVALYFIYKQLAYAKNIAALEFLLKLWERFSSLEMRKSRRKLAEVLINNPNDYVKIDELADDILRFFECLGLMVRKKTIPEDLAWQMNCYYVLRYWDVLSKYITWVRKKYNDLTYYSEVEHLHRKMLRLEERIVGKKITLQPSELQGFLEDEARC